MAQGPIAAALDIAADVLRSLREAAAARRRQLLARVRAAKQKALDPEAPGDTSELESIRDDQPSGG